MPKFFGAALFFLPGLAQAQELPTTPESEPEGTQEAVNVLPTPLFAKDWSWFQSTAQPQPDGKIRSINGLGGETGLFFSATEQGGVWKSLDDGRTWTEVLRAPISSNSEGANTEEMLLEAEALAEDLFEGEVEMELDPESLDEEILEEIGRIQDETDTLALEDWVADGETPKHLNTGSFVWVNPVDPSIVIVPRQDGIWQSSDEGETFDLVDPDIRINALASGNSGLLLAATTSGVAYSLDDGASWIEKTDAASGLACNGFLWTGKVWLLASDDGLYRSTDGEDWRLVRNGVAGEAILALASDPTTEGAGWLSTETEVLRFDQYGNRVYRHTQQNLLEMRHLLTTSRPGQVIAAGGDGVWESGDGGYTWAPLVRGLRSPDVQAIVQLGDGLLLGSANGLFQLKKAIPRQEKRTIPTQPKLNVLVHKALQRRGMDPRREGVKGANSAARRLLPELSLDGQLVQRNMLAADFFDVTNQADTDTDWRIQLNFRWGRGAGGSEPSDTEIGAVTDLFYILGGRIYSSDSPEAIQSATSRLLVDTSDYRMEVRQRLGDLYFARHRLIQQAPPDAGIDLRSAVLFQLDVQELTAWIDAYTDGSFSLALRDN